MVLGGVFGGVLVVWVSRRDWWRVVGVGGCWKGETGRRTEMEREVGAVGVKVSGDWGSTGRGETGCWQCGGDWTEVIQWWLLRGGFRRRVVRIERARGVGREEKK